MHSRVSRELDGTSLGRARERAQSEPAFTYAIEALTHLVVPNFEHVIWPQLRSYNYRGSCNWRSWASNSRRSLMHFCMRQNGGRFANPERLYMDVVDATRDRAAKEGAHEPTAIVGMAVKLPGANNADELWALLERGLNTLSEARPLPCLPHSPPRPLDHT